jgi:hypothetical protein
MFAKSCFFVAFCLLLTACSQAAPAPPTATAEPPTPTPPPPPVAGTLSVVPAAELGSISPYLFGSNYGPWIAVPFDMLAAAYDSHVTAIRFPGGEWGDRNDLKSYQIDQFIDFAGKVGAIPTISVRLMEGTAEKAAELVHYANVEKKYGVVYWSIGNEPTLFAAYLRTFNKAEDYDTEQFNREWREYALAMKEVDPGIKLIGPEIHQFNFDYNFNPKDSSGRDWMIEFLKANGDLVDIVSFHRYPFPKSQADINVTVEDLRQQTREWDKTIPYLRGLIADLTGRDLPIAITEVNTHWNKAIGGEATPDSHYNAIWLAEMLGRAIHQDLFMINHWLITSSGGLGGWGLIGRGELRPSYYVYQLYDKFGRERVYAESGVDDVSIYAANRQDGALTLLVINLADGEKGARLQLPEGLPAQAELWRLDQTQQPLEPHDFDFPGSGQLSLPPQSVSLFVIRR